MRSKAAEHDKLIQDPDIRRRLIKSIRGKFQKMPDGCWIWTGQRTKYGYAVLQLTIEGRHSSFKVHRVIWTIKHGPMPHGLVLDHLCRVRPCINPAHLEPVTNRENILRGTGPTARNAAKTHCLRGHLLDESNINWLPQYGSLNRSCKTCKKAYQLAAWHSKYSPKVKRLR